MRHFAARFEERPSGADVQDSRCFPFLCARIYHKKSRAVRSIECTSVPGRQAGFAKISSLLANHDRRWLQHSNQELDLCDPFFVVIHNVPSSGARGTGLDTIR